MNIQVTPVFQKLWSALNDDGVRGIVLEGGSRSSKTWSICQALDIIATTGTARIAVGRYRRTWIKPTVLDTYKKVLTFNETWESDRFNKTDLIYTYDNSTIEFYGMDDSQKFHGIETDYFWINEAIETHKDDFDQLEQRCKGKWILDYNPSTDEHWIYDNVLKRDDVVYIHSTMLDNSFLDDVIINKIKSYEPTPRNIKQGTADEYKFMVYGLGKRARREGAIYTNWQETTEFPEQTQWTSYGLDFGFTHDPTALIEVSYSNGEIWIKELIYEPGLTNEDIDVKARSLGINVRRDVIADSAEPKSIEDLRRRGWNIRGVDKGQDSVRAGIDKVKQYKINVHSDSMNTIKELRNYSWKRDFKTNQATNKPEDDNNHSLDAVRYVVMMKLKTGLGEYAFA